MICQVDSCYHNSDINLEPDQMEAELRTEKGDDDIINSNLLNQRSSDLEKGSNLQNTESESRTLDLMNSMDDDESFNQIKVSSSFLKRALECQYRLFHDNMGVNEEMNSLYENAYMMLSPELQPISPATDIAESMQIFEEHKQLAQQYLQTRTEIECLLKVKEGLEKQLQWEEGGGPLRDSPRFFQEMRELQSENVGLVQLHQNLKQQLNVLKGGRNPGQPATDLEPEPGWVMVPRR